MLLSVSMNSSVSRAGAEAVTPAGSASPPPTFYTRWGKRWLDVGFSSCTLLLLSPLLALVAILVKLTSSGPALYRQKAVGKGGRLFDYYKFRTMYTGSDDAEHRKVVRQVVQSQGPIGYDAEGRPVYKIIDDPRVTPLGRFLRRFSLDEMPQFYNVLRGDMSVVGPRPPLPYEAELYNADQRQRLAVRPGITGLAQVTVRHRGSFQEALVYDLEYIKHQGLLLDLRITLKTVPALLKGL